MAKRGLNIYKRKDGRWEGRIQAVEKSKALFLPTVTIQMQDGQAWKFLVFGRNSFLTNLKTAMDAYADSE